MDKVKHWDWGILYRLCSVGIGCSVLSILTQFLSNRSQHIMKDGFQSKLVYVVSGVLKSSVLRPLLLVLYTSELLSVLENKQIGYADDSILMAVVPSPGIRVKVAETLICALGRVSEWCDLWGMKLNASKTKTMQSLLKIVFLNKKNFNKNIVNFFFFFYNLKKGKDI